MRPPHRRERPNSASKRGAEPSSILPRVINGVRRGRGAIPAALVLGAFLALSAAPVHFVVTAFVFVPMFLWLTEGASTRRAFFLGWASGFACNAVTLHWTVGMLQDFGHFPLIGAVPTASLLFAAQALPFAFAPALATVLSKKTPHQRWWIYSVAMVVFFSYIPAIFPWRISSGQVEWLSFVQLADVLGSPGLDLAILFCGAGAYEAITRRRRVPAVLAVVALIIPLAYGVPRLSQIERLRDEAATLRVGVVQPNIGIHEKHDPRLRYPQLEGLRAQTKALEDLGAELTVWPESAYPFAIERGQAEDPVSRLSVRRDGVTGPVLFGAITRESRCEKWNSVVAMNPDGTYAGVSDKVELLIFGEYVPFHEYLTPLHEYVPCPGMTPGERAEVLPIAGANIGVMNCYEDVLPRYGRELAAERPDLLINVTNDAWFGDTTEPILHHMIARMRSVETRRDLIRAVNTGVSGHISATGESLLETNTYERTIFIASARRLNVETFWVRYGDLLSGPLALLLVVLSFIRRREYVLAR